MSEVDIKSVLGELKTNSEGLLANYAQMQAEIKNLGSASADTKGQIDKFLANEARLTDELKGLRADLNALQLKHDTNAFGDGGKSARKSLGERFIESDEAKSTLFKGNIRSGAVRFGADLAKSVKAAVTTENIGAGALPQAARIETFTDPKRELVIRDLMTVIATNNPALEYVKYTYTPAAKIIYSPSPNATRENILKPEAALAFTIARAAAETLAVWIPISKQALNDIPGIRSIIDTEMMFDVAKKEEDEILNGDGTAGHLNGLKTQATAYDTALNATGDTPIDTIRHGLLQSRLARYAPDAILINPADAHDIELAKDGQGRYLIGDPQGVLTPRLWGKPLIETEAVAAGHFLLGAFGRAARLYDLEEANIETTDSHADFFARNMYAIRCEERLMLVVTRPQAFIYGAL